MPLTWIFEALLDVGTMAAVDAVTTKVNAVLSPLDAELEKLRKLLADFDLSITLSNPAREGIESLDLDRQETTEYVRKHIRVPLSRMINDGRVNNGNRIRIEWEDGPRLIVQQKKP